jgi:hypothetical protein
MFLLFLVHVFPFLLSALGKRRRKSGDKNMLEEGFGSADVFLGRTFLGG